MEPNPTSGCGPKLGFKTPYFSAKVALCTEQCHDTHRASIIFQELIPRVKPFVTPRASVASNYVSELTEMNLKKGERFFFPS